MNEQSEYITEAFGFKTIAVGFTGYVGSVIAEINWIGFFTIVLTIGGAVIQILAYQRGKREESRNKIKHDLDVQKHDLEIQFLKKQLEDKNTAEV